MISVIIPLYNRKETIERSIKSVLSQTYTDIEIIVVDDGSTDDWRKTICRDMNDKIKVIRLEENHGAGYARNVGLSEAKGEFIAFQDSDDEWRPDKLTVQMNYIKEQGCDVVFSSYVLHDLEGREIIIPIEMKWDSIKSVLSYTNVMGTPTILMNRKVYDKLGGFDTSLPKLEDYEYAIRMAKSYKIGFIIEPLVDVYLQSNSLTYKKLDSEALTLIMCKHRDFVDIKNFVRKVLSLSYLESNIENGVDTIVKLNEGTQGKCIDYILEVMYKECTYMHRMRCIDYKLFEDRMDKRHFAIYGAGKVAKKVFHKYRDKGMKPFCFLVTKKEKNESLFDVPIFGIDEIKNKDLDIVVAVGEKLKNEIYEVLLCKGFHSFVTYEE